MEFKKVTTLVELHKLKQSLLDLNQYYPDFAHWYMNKVIPSVILNNDEVILAMRHNEIAGISIVKQSEKKLRCLRVFPNYQKSGTLMYLIDESLKILDTDKPSCSVPEELIHGYSRTFVNRYFFDLTYVHKGLYRRNKLEYQFNGDERTLKESELFI